MISYFHVDSMAKMLRARPDNGVTTQLMMSQTTNHVIKMARTSKILMSGEICQYHGTLS